MVDEIRRKILATGAAATAIAAVQGVFGQDAGKAAGAMSFYEKGPVRIRRHARSQSRSQHVPLERSQGPNPPGRSPDPFLPQGPSPRLRLRAQVTDSIAPGTKKSCPLVARLCSPPLQRRGLFYMRHGPIAVTPNRQGAAPFLF